MRSIPFSRWIANAAARLTGPHGAVTRQAQEAGCSRQTVYDHSQKVSSAVEAEHGGGQTRAELIRVNEALRLENTQLWEWLFQTIEFPLAKQQHFAVTAMAMGLSLSQTLVLLAILLGAKAYPSRATVHRWVQAAGKAAGEVLNCQRRFEPGSPQWSWPPESERIDPGRVDHRPGEIAEHRLAINELVAGMRRFLSPPCAAPATDRTTRSAPGVGDRQDHRTHAGVTPPDFESGASAIAVALETGCGGA